MSTKIPQEGLHTVIPGGLNALGQLYRDGETIPACAPHEGGGDEEGPKGYIFVSPLGVFWKGELRHDDKEVLTHDVEFWQREDPEHRGILFDSDHGDLAPGEELSIAQIILGLGLKTLTLGGLPVEPVQGTVIIYDFDDGEVIGEIFTMHRGDETLTVNTLSDSFIATWDEEDRSYHFNTGISVETMKEDWEPGDAWTIVSNIEGLENWILEMGPEIEAGGGDAQA